MSEQPQHGAADDQSVTGPAALNRLFAADGPADLDEGVFQGPLYWPRIPAVDIEAELRDLYVWVDGLLQRFEHLDHKVIPPCWWLHNGHVEALAALRDSEHSAYTDASPGGAGVSWHRDFQLIEARLRDWTALYGCTAKEHKARAIVKVSDAAPGTPEWEAHVASERQMRERREFDG